MAIHSQILVHWTGAKDIEKKTSTKKVQEYVERLEDYCNNGLFLNKTNEPTIRRLKVKYLRKICFTEIRLSQVQTHAKRYGKLGIGLKRDFVLNKGGRPVIYIPFVADNCLLEESLKTAYEKSKGYDEIREALKWLLTHVKRMSDKNGKEDCFEEMEWRLVGKESKDKRLKFKASDVKIIIFPNEKTKQESLKSKLIMGFFNQHFPNMVTLKDCRHF